MARKLIVGGIFTIGAIIFGFLMLLRSCLAKYDERSIISPPVVVNDNGKAVVFSLVKYEKATSYSRNGGFVRKSVSTSYYVQTNDAVTGGKLESKKIKKHSQLKSFPIEIMGLSNKRVWLFAGELMAFDPFTLEAVADQSILEEKNPSLKGKFPQDRRFYELDSKSDKISITANDGTKYFLNTQTLAMTIDPEEDNTDELKARVKEIDEKGRQLRILNDSNYSRYRNANKLYSERKISSQAYQDSSKRFQDERNHLSRIEDSFRHLLENVQDEVYAKRDQEQMENKLRGNISFHQMKVNADSFHQKWYGLYTTEKIKELRDQFDYQNLYDDVARNKFYTASLTAKNPADKYSKWTISLPAEKLSDAIYLQGGFLLDIYTGKPIHLTGPDGFLVVAREQVGNDANIVLNRINVDGKQTWSVKTGLKEFAYWTISNGRFYLFGTDNKELSSGQINVLHIIDLSKGSMVTHDYYKDKNR